MRWWTVALLYAVPIEGAAQGATRGPLRSPHPLAPAASRLREVALTSRLPRPQDDRWLGADKLRHAGASAAIQIMGFGVLRSARVGQSRSLVAAGLVSLAAGVGKELRDRRGGGDPSARDLVWDVVGIAVGSGLALAADVR